MRSIHWRIGFADDRKSADFTFAVYDFFVRENCAELFAPPDRCSLT